MKELDHLIDTLRAKREELGWTKVKVAKRIGITDGALGFYEHRDCNPKLPQMAAWAAALGYRLVLLPDPEAQRKLELDLGKHLP